MNIYLDNIIFSLQRAGGISNYWAQLLSRISRSDHTVAILENENVVQNIYRKELRLNFPIINEKSWPFNINRYLNPSLGKSLPGVFHSSYYRVVKNKNIMNVVTVHDFTYEYFRSTMARTIHSMQKSQSLKHADAIICVSNNTKKDLLKFYPDINHEKISVVYNAAAKDFYPLSSIKFENYPYQSVLDNNFIIYIGDRVSYKNFPMVAEVINEFPFYHLVLVGGKPLAQWEIQMLESKLKGRYTHLTGLNNTDLNILYNYAFCLLYPSSYEGFGIPILEAMQAGCPVVTTNLSSIPEVAGSAALLVEKPDTKTLVTRLEELEDYQTRRELIKRGFSQSSKFSWDKCFEETMTIYRKIFNKFS